MTQHVNRKFTTPVKQHLVAADWTIRGYSCELFVDPPGREWNEFVHNRNELITVVEGRLMLTIGDKERAIEPGDEVLIPRGSLHSVRNIHQGPTQWLYGYD